MRQDYKAKLVLTEQQYNQRIVSFANLLQSGPRSVTETDVSTK